MPRPPAPPDPFVAHLLDLLAPLGPVAARPMFGGHGFFQGGVMFALVWRETFFVRTDERNRPVHEAEALAQFLYPDRCGRPKRMPYFQVPPAALDDAEEMERWARPALEAARRNARG
jgi:DNA transformation protein